MQFVIIDQSFMGVAGHHAEYTLCIAREAAKIAAVTILTNYKCEFSSSDSIKIHPTFRFPWTRPQRMQPPASYDATISYPAWPFLADLRRGLGRIDLGPEDHVFIHSVGFIEIEDLLALLMTWERPALPVFDILLRRDLDEIRDDAKRFRRFVAYLKAFTGLGFCPDKARFFTDTEQLTEQYTSVSDIPFATLAIPFDQHAMQRALKTRPRKTPGEPVVVGYLGDARPEKGYQFLPAVVSKLMHSHLLSGKARLRLQSNYNLPGGETPAMPQARRVLERCGPAVELLYEALDQQEYYRQLAEMDIIVLPYVRKRYARRSSGIFVQAAAAGKVIVVPHGTTMWAAAQCYGMKNCIGYDSPDELPAAVAGAIDHYSDLAPSGPVLGHRWSLANSPATLVSKLVGSGSLGKNGLAASHKSPLVLHVVDGHCAYHRTGTEMVQDAQRRFLRATGYRVATIFVVRTYPSEADLASWIERNYEYWFATECVFSWLVCLAYPTNELVPSLKREIEATELLSIPDTLRGVISSGAIDLIWLNKVTMAPLLDLLGAGTTVPTILETHDIQSFQYATERGGEVEKDELELELSLLDRFDRLISLSGSESLMMVARVGRERVATITPPLFQEPLSVRDLAGAQDLGEVVSSARSDLDFVDFERAHRSRALWQFEALTSATGIDLLFVASVHPPNMLSLDWFLDSIYEPHLAPRGVTLLCAGSLSATEWALHRQRRFPTTLFLAGRVDNLRPLYAAAKLIILPITEGAGVNIKTIEAMSFGKPIVATSVALRGLPRAEETVQTFDDAPGFANRIVALLDDFSLRRDEALRNWQLAAEQRDPRSYFGSVAGVFGDVLGARAMPPIASDYRGTWEYLEWDDPLKSLNHFARCLIERQSYLLESSRYVESVLSRSEMRGMLYRILTVLVSEQTAPVLESQSYLKDFVMVDGESDLEKICRIYTRAYLPYSLVKSNLRLLAGCQSLSDLLRVSGISDETRKAEGILDIDITVIAQDAQGRSSRVFVENFMEFYENCYLPYFFPKGITMVVIGDLGLDVSIPGVFAITQIADLAPILAATRLIIAPWNDSAVLDPAVMMAMLQAITACKPLIARPSSMWFIGEAERADFVADSPQELASRVEELLSNPRARLAAAAKTRDLASHLLANLAEWQDWQDAGGMAAQDLMSADIRFAEWGPWLRWSADLIVNVIDGRQLAINDIRAFEQDLRNPRCRAAWQELVDAMFGRRDALILRHEALSERARSNAGVSRVRNLDDFIFEVKRASFQIFDLVREHAGEWMSERQRSARYLLDAAPAGGQAPNDVDYPDPRRILIKAKGDTAALDLLERVPGFGWYPAEGNTNGYHRWTGPEPRFSLELFLPEQPYRCSVVMSPGEPKNFDDFSVSINDELSPYDCETAADGTTHLSFMLPHRPHTVPPSLGIVTFRHASVSEPGVLETKDRRRLGFAVRSIRFSPVSLSEGDKMVEQEAEPSQRHGRTRAADRRRLVRER